MAKSYTLPEPREHYIVNAGVIRSSIGCSIGFLADLKSCPAELCDDLKELADEMTRGNLSGKKVSEVQALCRTASWKYLHLGRHKAAEILPQELRALNQEKEKVAAALMMLLDALVEAPGTSHMRKRIPCNPQD